MMENICGPLWKQKHLGLFEIIVLMGETIIYGFSLFLGILLLISEFLSLKRKKKRNGQL